MTIPCMETMELECTRTKWINTNSSTAKVDQAMDNRMANPYMVWSHKQSKWSSEDMVPQETFMEGNEASQHLVLIQITMSNHQPSSH